MFTYIILAQIALTVGTPDWVVTMCYVLAGANLVFDIIRGAIKAWLEKNDQQFALSRACSAATRGFLDKGRSSKFSRTQKIVKKIYKIFLKSIDKPRRCAII